MKREPLEVERLIRADQRFTIADHERFRRELAAQQSAQQADPIDDALADPVLDHLPQYRSSKSTSRLLGLLDELNREEPSDDPCS